MLVLNLQRTLPIIPELRCAQRTRISVAYDHFILKTDKITLSSDREIFCCDLSAACRRLRERWFGEETVSFPVCSFLKQSFCQDRLGTNIGETQKTDCFAGDLNGTPDNPDAEGSLGGCATAHRPVMIDYPS
eukprot:COSAG06_NODE_4030_length_4642_cov_26.582435_1_plen_132_part_00